MITSGAIYPGVPEVSFELFGDHVLAIPKSVTFAIPSSVIIILCILIGFFLSRFHSLVSSFHVVGLLSVLEQKHFADGSVTLSKKKLIGYPRLKEDGKD